MICLIQQQNYNVNCDKQRLMYLFSICSKQVSYGGYIIQRCQSINETILNILTVQCVATHLPR